ncbi:alpha/beta hydrolase-fold protein [Colwellia sp. 4_MG-2023]|uniref:alpha/beta hydrolase n=1 Tax=unclassified Colwellia TaxID=196834 RepID=UPI0026E24D24|nr:MULTISPECIES: alpha/beta hydrolase-fold protein [unclassified Colwellia]MDO6508523.1 alpha/beta hydrolase-fold protein [Colwellia sp. 5_MG-2023]MDO6557138.1 alpha/beta hydrolase-fold protein [Colwellia sp. 4_MG-2023]
MRVLFFSIVLLCSKFSLASGLMLAEEIKLQSNSLGEERNLLIKLPKKYHNEDNSYPVLYVLHGQWDMLSTLSTLDLLEDQVPNFIVVGIESRGKELSPENGKTTPFANFLAKEVVPYVNENYRVAAYSILSGHSNSGRFVLDYWLSDNPVFSKYFAFSSSLDDGYIVDKVSKSNSEVLKTKAPLTITIANEGEHMQNPFTELTKKLSNLPKGSFEFQNFPNQSHRTTKHPSMQYALQSTFAGWEPTYEVKISGLDGLKEHYTDLSKKYGFKVLVPTETLQKLTAHYAISENATEELYKHIAFTINQSSEGIDSLFEISDYLSSNGYKEAGESILNEICNQAKNNKRCSG